MNDLVKLEVEQQTKNNESEEVRKKELDSFELLDFIGQGAYGKVLKVVDRLSGEILAMKIMPKKSVLKKNDSSYIREERDIMTKMAHPFIISLRFAFQTDTKLYLVMDYAAGGELFEHLWREGLFLQPIARFYLAELILAIEYLHSRKVVHRDLKPENVLLDEQGHIKLTDFGLAKSIVCEIEKTSTICGTDLYMAPEMLRGNGYGKSVDWWSVGALGYEMMTGDPPFDADETEKLYKLIMSSSLKFPKIISMEARSVIRGLLTRDVTKRLGNVASTMFKIGGVEELKRHEFFEPIDLVKLGKCQIDAPFDKKNIKKSTYNVKKSKAQQDKEKRKRENILKEEQRPSRKTDEFEHKDFNGFSFAERTFLEAVTGENDDVRSETSEEITLLENDSNERVPLNPTEEEILKRMSSFSLGRR